MSPSHLHRHHGFRARQESGHKFLSHCNLALVRAAEALAQAGPHGEADLQFTDREPAGLDAPRWSLERSLASFIGPDQRPATAFAETNPWRS